ncbi:MAG: hypothetical protein M3440_10045 [Chloroflexota bacterium]|nr:hypothetical protein [Chloroflexota bacterium]
MSAAPAIAQQPFNGEDLGGMNVSMHAQVTPSHLPAPTVSARFWHGLAFALPPSIALWVGLIWVIRQLLR